MVDFVLAMLAGMGAFFRSRSDLALVEQITELRKGAGLSFRDDLHIREAEEASPIGF